MTPEEVAQWSALAGQISGNGLFLLAIVGLLRGWVVTKAHLDDVKQEHEDQIALLLRMLDRCNDQLKDKP